MSCLTLNELVEEMKESVLPLVMKTQVQRVISRKAALDQVGAALALMQIEVACRSIGDRPDPEGQ